MKTTLLLLLSFLTISTQLLFAEGHAKKKPANKKAAKKVEKTLTPAEIAENKRFGALPAKYRKSLLELDKTHSRLVDSWVDIAQGDAAVSSCDNTWGVKSRKNAEKLKDGWTNDRLKLTKKFYKNYDRDLPKLEKLIKRKQKEIDKAANLKPVNNTRITEIRDKELAALKAEESLYADLVNTLEEMNSSVAKQQSSSSKPAPTRLSQIGISIHGGNTAVYNEGAQYESVVLAVYDIKDIKADIEMLESRKQEGENWKSRDDGILKTAKSNLSRSGDKLKKIVGREQLKLKKNITKLERDIDRLKLKIEKLPENSKTRDRYNDKLYPLETDLFALQDTMTTLTRLADWEKM